MRLDKYLKVSRLIKRRTVANEACDAGKITVNDKVARASYDVKVGDVSIGYVGAGQTVTSYFYAAKDTSSVTADGFSAVTGYNGTIDLILNYTYQLFLRNTTAMANYFNINGYSIANGDDTISMK